MREGYYKPRPLPRKPFPPRSNVPKEPPKIKPHNKKKKSPNILVIGLIALVLLIAIIILLVKIFGGNSGSDNNGVEDLEMKISNAFVEGNSLNVVVDVISDDSSLESIKFIMEGYGKQEIFLEDYTSNSISENEFSFNLKDLDLEEVSKISVVPVVKDKKGNIETGSVKDIYNFYYKPDNNDDDDDDVPYDSYWNYSNSDSNTSLNCTPQNDYECYNGDVYWFDSCDELGELKENCTSDEVCFLGTCAASGGPTNPPGPVNPGCGDNLIESGEYCDGYNLGGETCASFGFNLGTLACNSYCTFDLSNCYNNGGGSADPNPGANCVLTPYYSCYQGDVWFYDSCGAPLQVKDYCGSGEECVSNECKTQSTNYPPPPLPPPIPQ